VWKIQNISTVNLKVFSTYRCDFVIEPFFFLLLSFLRLTSIMFMIYGSFALKLNKIN